jgi:hypothetical protein
MIRAVPTPGGLVKHLRKFLAAGLVAGALAIAGAGGAAAADPVPSGQRVLGQSVVEPVYDADNAGVVRFISTPQHAPLNSDQRAWAPLYLPVYPAGSTVGQLICPHTPVDTCPDHGPVIAGLARSVAPGVYGGGVIGHDHVARLRGVGFHVALEPVVVLFTSAAAANEHLTTRVAIEAAIARGDAVAIPLEAAALHGEQVSSQVWADAVPVS